MYAVLQLGKYKQYNVQLVICCSLLVKGYLFINNNYNQNKPLRTRHYAAGRYVTTYSVLVNYLDVVYFMPIKCVHVTI